MSSDGVALAGDATEAALQRGEAGLARVVAGVEEQAAGMAEMAAAFKDLVGQVGKAEARSLAAARWAPGYAQVKQVTELRNGIIETLTAEGMSSRDIGSVLGVDGSTVRRALAPEVVQDAPPVIPQEEVDTDLALQAAEAESKRRILKYRWEQCADPDGPQYTHREYAELVHASEAAIRLSVDTWALALAEANPPRPVLTVDEAKDSVNQIRAHIRAARDTARNAVAQLEAKAGGNGAPIPATVEGADAELGLLGEIARDAARMRVLVDPQMASLGDAGAELVQAIVSLQEWVEAVDDFMADPGQ